jgi:hypothetical protein
VSLSTGSPALDTWLGTMAMVLAMAGVLAWGVEVRSGRGDSELVTAAEAEEFAERVAAMAMTAVGVGGARLTARACETCVVVSCRGAASGDELERFAAALLAAAEMAGRYVAPESVQAKRSKARKLQRQGAA